jgi:hypothetical protein
MAALLRNIPSPSRKRNNATRNKTQSHLKGGQNRKVWATRNMVSVLNFSFLCEGPLFSLEVMFQRVLEPWKSRRRSDHPARFHSGTEIRFSIQAARTPEAATPIFTLQHRVRYRSEEAAAAGGSGDGAICVRVRGEVESMVAF